MTKRPQIGHVGTRGQDMAYQEVGQHLQGGQGQVTGPQVLLLGHGYKIESPNWAFRDCRTLNDMGGHPTSKWWPGASWWTTGASSRPCEWHIDPNLARKENCEPWGYVAPVVAAVMTRATGVRQIYLIFMRPS